MRYLFILCCRWYHPEGEAALRGETVDYDPLRLAILADEQACDRMDLPHAFHAEGAEALLMARMGWLHEAQGRIENHFDLELAHGGFDDEHHIVDVLTTHDVKDAGHAHTLALAWRQALVECAQGQADGIGPIVQVGADCLEAHDISALFDQAAKHDAFESDQYRFHPLSEDA